MHNWLIYGTASPSITTYQCARNWFELQAVAHNAPAENSAQQKFFPSLKTCCYDMLWQWDAQHASICKCLESAHILQENEYKIKMNVKGKPEFPSESTPAFSL